MIKFGVIGTGWIAEEFVKGTALTDGLEFSAVYSRTVQKGTEFASQFGGATVFDNIDEFAASDIDAVYIASPNSLHYNQSKLMLEHGKHVLCEKPVTVTPAQFSELRSLAKSKNLIYTEAVMYLHLPQRKVLLESLKKIGKITTAHFDFSQLSSKYEALKNGGLPNIFNPEFATGCLMDLGIYCLYPAIDIFGEPKNVISSASLLPTGVDGCGSSIFEYDDKCVTLTYSKLGQSGLGSQILGDGGTITTPSISKLINMTLIQNDSKEIPLTGECEKHVLMSFEARDFYEYIKGRKLDEYERFNDMIFCVNTYLEKIRNNCKIFFK